MQVRDESQQPVLQFSSFIFLFVSFDRNRHHCSSAVCTVPHLGIRDTVNLLPPHTLQSLGEDLWGHSMFMLQDQTLLQGDRHGSPILGTFTARKPNTIQSAAYLETRYEIHHSFLKYNFPSENTPVFLLPRQTKIFCRTVMSKVVNFGAAVLCCMSCRENSDVKIKTFSLSPHGQGSKAAFPSNMRANDEI